MSCEQIIGRAIAAVSLVVAPPCCATATVLCAVTSLFEALSGGSYCKDAGKELKFYAGNTTAALVNPLIHILNPDADINQNAFSVNVLATKHLANAVTHCRDEGSNWFVRHVVSRAAAFGTMLVSLATRVIDIAIGVIALPFALLTGGKFNSLNSMAVRGFASIGLIVSDVILGLINTINPALHEPKRGAYGFDT